ncbi:thiol peroxidase [Chondromyces crocatus]|uniref:Thiol peroxidase n=1 Tax=Chondromyces crocatus TaxID=52 RepID=A0A0K1EFC2_CHOCO|nr:thiol peroxidase [Chondromyces crocatus]AKT39402.1 thiol peroxidase [Chondromyces crocatus]
MGHTTLWLGHPTELEGPRLSQGDGAPADFSLTSNEMQPIPGEALSGKPRVLVAVPSLDTPVCDRESRRFNEEAAKLPGVSILIVSMDLPFAQQRWCGAAGIERVKTFSDFKERSFGRAYGVFAPAVGLLARAVFVIDASDVVQHVEYLSDVSDEPDYDAALKAARALG